MVRTNMLEQPNFAGWLSKCLKNNLFSQKLSLKSQPVSCRRHCRHRKKATLQTKMAKTEDASVKKEDGRKNNGAHLKVPDHLKKPKKEYVPTGKPRGRKPGQKNKKTMRAEKQSLAMQAANKSE